MKTILIKEVPSCRTEMELDRTGRARAAGARVEVKAKVRAKARARVRAGPGVAVKVRAEARERAKAVVKADPVEAGPEEARVAKPGLTRNISCYAGVLLCRPESGRPRHAVSRFFWARVKAYTPPR